MIDFLQRMPSAQWEQIQFPSDSRLVYWVWFKPPNFPQGLVLRLCEEALQSDPALQQGLTMRALLLQVGIDPAGVVSWSVNGILLDAQQGQNPCLDEPLPVPVAGVDPGIFVAILVQQPFVDPAWQAPVMNPVAAMSAGQATPSEMELLESIDSEWNDSRALEADLSRLRKMLIDMTGQLKSLNRDLNTDEYNFSSSQDKRDWQDARRWLRDCLAGLSRSLKEYDIGVTSNAGERVWFEQMHEQFVISRKPFEGLVEANIKYQIYHKTLRSLHNSIKNGLQHAAQNGERRARKILATIAAKVRQGKTKSSFLGVITGK